MEPKAATEMATKLKKAVTKSWISWPNYLEANCLTRVKSRSREALVPPFESSRRDLHDGHGFSDFLFLRFVVVLHANRDILWGRFLQR